MVSVLLQSNGSSLAQPERPRGRGMSTRILHPAAHPVEDPYAAVSPPLYQVHAARSIPASRHPPSPALAL